MDEVRARVILQEKGLYKISYEGMENAAEISGKFRYQAGSALDYPAVGDYVVASWPEDGSHSIISSIFPRKSVFIRKAAGTGNTQQVVAANIDTVFICVSLNQDFNLRRMERYIAISRDSGAVPVLVLTKSDLSDDLSSKIAEAAKTADGIDVITTSSKLNDTAEIERYLTCGKTYAFIGSSGVGKSTLINKLTGKNAIRTSEIREDDGKGRHTTTHRELIGLSNGAYVIDTPGMRELGLWNNEDGVERVFSDIERIISKCRFSDCTHVNEPGCRIIEALRDGTLKQDRWEAYKKLITENFYNSDGKEYMKAKKAKFKEIAMINRRKR